ncbi:MAG: hypothetical protein IPH13_15485 [Planctomycetes bacterium]|nr:hypothetical protein [Planctomycetota bacterium]
MPDLVEQDGFEFIARLDVEVPGVVLARHGQRVAGSVVPASECADHHGRFVAAFRVLRIGGYGRDEGYGREPMPTTIDSAVGPVARDGGAFLVFLKAARALAEADGARAARIDALRRLARSTPEFAAFARRLGADFAERCVDSA